MAYYGVYDIETGALLSVATKIDPDAIKPTSAFVVLPHCPDWSVETWDTATKTLVPRALSKDDIERLQLEPYYEDWMRWKETLAEATARGINATILSELKAKVNNEWTQYVNAVLAWRNAN